MLIESSLLDPDILGRLPTQRRTTRQIIASGAYLLDVIRLVHCVLCNLNLWQLADCIYLHWFTFHYMVSLHFCLCIDILLGVAVVA